MPVDAHYTGVSRGRSMDVTTIWTSRLPWNECTEPLEQERPPHNPGLSPGAPLAPNTGSLRASCRQRGEPLQSAGTPEVPFRAAVWRATVAVLSRCSVLGRVRSVSGSGAAGAVHSTDCRGRFCCSLQSGQAASVLAPVAAPGTAHGVWGMDGSRRPTSIPSECAETWP